MSTRSRLDRLIAFEGIDGAGTTTQARLLRDRISDEGLPVWATSEPTDSEIGLLARRVLAGDVKTTPETVAYLFATDRWEHVFGDGGIIHHHNTGELVICDRYYFSSIVYQGVECDTALVESLNAGFPEPRCVIFVDLDIESGEQRLSRRRKRDIYETTSFQERVRARYDEVLGRVAGSTTVIRVSGTDPAPVVHRNIWEAVQRTSILEP